MWGARVLPVAGMHPTPRRLSNRLQRGIPGPRVVCSACPKVTVHTPVRVLARRRVGALAIRLIGAPGLPLHSQCTLQVHASGREVGVDFNGSSEMFNGRIDFPEVYQSGSPIVVRNGDPRVDFEAARRGA